MVNYNISSFQGGGIGMIYGAMNKAQVAQAQMEISGYEFARNTLPLMNLFNNCSLIMKQQQAQDYITQSYIQAGQDFGQVAVIAGTAAVTAGLANGAANDTKAQIDSLTKPEVDVQLTSQEGNASGNESGQVGGRTGDSNNIDRDNLSKQEEVTVENKPQTEEEKAAEQKRIAEQKELAEKQKAAKDKYDEDVRKLNDKGEAKQNSMWSTATGMVAPALQSAVKGGFDVPLGKAQAQITTDGAIADYEAQLSSGVVSQNLSAINSYIQSCDQREQAAAQVVLSMIQISGPI